MTGWRLGKYEVYEEIGAGGFGTVYRAFDPDLKRTVAIKVLSGLGPGLRDRFLREAEIVAGLQHPNITVVFDFGSEAGQPYLVEEYLSGRDLEAVLESRDDVPVERRLDWLVQAAQALDHAHSRGVIHRDVKPANLRLLDDGRVKVMDFGVAKLLSAQDNLTRTGTTMGTAGYLAPEQLRGETVDHRADIFSFGVVAYEVLSHRRAFAGENTSAVLYQVAHEEPPPLAEVWPGCFGSLEVIVHRCLAKSPDDRFTTLGPVIAGLQEARSSQLDPGDRRRPDARPGPRTSIPPPSRPTRQEAMRERRPRGGTDPRTSGRGSYRTVRRPGFRTLWTLAGLLVVAAVLGVWGFQAHPSRDGDMPVEVQPPGDPGGRPTEPRETVSRPVPDEPESTPTVEASSRSRAVDPPRPSESPSKPEPGTESSGAAAVRPETDRCLVVVGGDPAEAAMTAETALLRELIGNGVDAVGAGANGEARGSRDLSQVLDLARRHGASTVVSATFQGDARPSVGRFYTGRAVLEIRLYAVASGRLLHADTFEVGSAQTPGKLAPAELTALSEAARVVGSRAGGGLVAWLAEGRSRP